MNIQTVIKVIEKYTDVQWADEYGEPGYKKEFPDQPILFANWNDVPSHIMRYVERHINTEWSDEWITDERQKAYRTQGDSYFWKKYFVLDESCEISDNG